MSIANEIARIKTNIEKAYAECDDSYATMPQTQNSENLSSTISTIIDNAMQEIENGLY